MQTYVDIIAYAEYYCKKDCEVLLNGLLKLEADLQQVFQNHDTKFEGIKSYLSISAIGYALANKYGCFTDCFMLAGKPQHFIMKCISGGRVMMCRNEKQKISEKIIDFDAVSLYPSAMSIMPGVPIGIPKIIPNDIPFNPLSYSTYFIEISIDNIDDIYDFPLVFEHKDNKKTFKNTTSTSFYLDKTSLLDLITYYPNFRFTFKRGYYFDEGFNTSINTFITSLFELRLKYKQEHNPLETTIKLLLNSIYGKSILKAIDTEIVSIDNSVLEDYIILNQHRIKEISIGKKAYVKLIKPINSHFNLPQLGVSVLSSSKFLMNRLMCLAYHQKIPIFYQDTDSVHMLADDVERLSKAFYNTYHTELIGSKLTQFHSDFTPLNDLPTFSKKLIAVGKKCYCDVLYNSNGDIAYHFRLKGIPQNVIITYCEKNKITIEQLYEQLYDGHEITFNLLEGSQCFRKDKTYQQFTCENFKRKVKF
jgi:hypothetical protein